MARPSKLTPHAPRIQRLMLEGATALAIWEDLKTLEVPVSYEGVRKWIKSNPVDGVSLKGRGRPRSVEAGRFDFLPDTFSVACPLQTPVFMLPFLAIFSGTEEIRLELTKRAFGQLGLPFDEVLPRTEWVLPALRLANLSDLDYCIVAYLVSDLPSPPLGGITQHFDAWFAQLMVGACRLKTAVKQECDIRGKNLFGEPDAPP